MSVYFLRITFIIYHYSIMTKYRAITLTITAILLFTATWSSGQNKPATNGSVNKAFVHEAIGNPYLPLWEHLPDGEPRVFEDPDRPGRYRAYIIGSHDLRVNSYCGPDIRAW